MNTRQLEFYKQRLEESTYDLYDTVTQINRIIAAKTIDWILFFIGFFAVGYVTVRFESIPNVLLMVVIVTYVALYFLIKALLRGHTIGYLLLGIRFVNVRTKEKVSLKEYLMYIRKIVKLEVRYNEIFSYYLSYKGRLNQNQPMKRFGMVLVDSNRYAKFYKEYKQNIKIFSSLQSELGHS